MRGTRSTLTHWSPPERAMGHLGSLFARRCILWDISASLQPAIPVDASCGSMAHALRRLVRAVGPKCLGFAATSAQLLHDLTHVAVDGQRRKRSVDQRQVRWDMADLH